MLAIASVSARVVLAACWCGTHDVTTIIAVVAVALVALVLGRVPNRTRRRCGTGIPTNGSWIEEGATATVSIQERSDGTRVMYLEDCTRPTTPRSWSATTA